MNGHADLIDLASERLGGRALVASDDFFAEKENLLRPEKAVFIAGKFTDRGKWMDGWESRRKRGPGHDWCIIALGRPGIIHGVNVDTSHFNGNQPEACTLLAAELPSSPEPTADAVTGVRWTDVIPRTPLNPSSEHLIEALPEARGRRFTHVLFNIFPDGGVARLRVHGEVLPDWTALAAEGGVLDLAAAENGGLVVACNDMHFGSRHNMIMPGRAVNMGDGWETRRKRQLKGGEFDWAVVRLGHRGTVTRIVVDTNHFKGNFPESCEIEACDAGDAGADDVGLPWRVLLPRTGLRASEEHVHEKEIVGADRALTHARLKIFPDGGISRLRLFGRVAR